jgi:hypothetical protein
MCTSARDATYAPHGHRSSMASALHSSQACLFVLTWCSMRKSIQQQRTIEPAIILNFHETSSLVNSPDHMQTVQRLSDEEVRHSRETRPLAPTSYSSLCQDQPWHMAAQSQDKFTSRRSRQTLHGSSSSASATVAPLYQPENFRRSSDADISTQFGGKPFVGGSTVCIVLINASGWSCIIAALLEPDLLTAQSQVLVQSVNRHLLVAHSCTWTCSRILDKA